MLRLMTIMLFIYGLCLALVSGWHWSRAEEETDGVAWIIFTAVNDTGTVNLYRMRWDGLMWQRLSHNSSFDNNPHMSPDGQWIVFVSGRDGNLEIYRMHVDGSQQQNLTQNPQRDFGANITSDGRWIIYTTDQGSHKDIYRMRLDGTQKQNLTPAMDSVELFYFTDQWVFFYTLQYPKSTNYRMRSDGTNIEEFNLTTFITRDPNAIGGSVITPNQEWRISLFYDKDAIRIFRAYANVFTQPELLFEQFYNRSNQFLVDYNFVETNGNWIYWVGYPNNNLDIYRMRIDGTEVQPLIQSPYNDYRLKISPDGQWLFFVSEADGDRNTYRVKIDGSQLEQLTFTFGDEFLNDFAPLPDYSVHHETAVGLGVVLILEMIICQYALAKLPKF